MAISCLSFVKSLNAFSIVDVSVLESTTRKFRWASGPSVTCYCRDRNKLVYNALVSDHFLSCTYPDARKEKTRYGAGNGDTMSVKD